MSLHWEDSESELIVNQTVICSPDIKCPLFFGPSLSVVSFFQFSEFSENEIVSSINLKNCFINSMDTTLPVTTFHSTNNSTRLLSNFIPVIIQASTIVRCSIRMQEPYISAIKTEFIYTGELELLDAETRSLRLIYIPLHFPAMYSFNNY